MLDFKKKRRIKEILYSRITIIFLVVVFIFFANSTWDIYKKSRFASENRTIAENNLDKIKKRENILVYKINKLNTKRGVEEEIRNKFGFVKKGEDVVVVVTPNKKDKNDSIKSVSFAERWWRKLLDLF